jgi:hypothetical protein
MIPNPHTLSALADFPSKLEACYAEVPAEFGNWRPHSWQGIPSEAFSPIEQICHVRDVETDGYHVRFTRTLEESNPYLPDLDGEMLAKERDYSAASAADVLASLRAARAKTMQLIAGLTAQQLARPAQFNGGSVTMLSLVHYLCSHDQQHLAGLQWLLAKIRAPHFSG